jgi:acetoin utilization protein AcuC
MLIRPHLIGSEVFRRTALSSTHPLARPRAPVTIDFLRAMGWLDQNVYIDSPKATPLRLGRFHDAAYIDAAMYAEATQNVSPEIRSRFGFGTGDNPIFPGVIARAATACGSAVKAAKILSDGGIVYSPGGGAHHAHSSLAAGFCYFNDAVLAIYSMLDDGLSRVCYIDIDAHHGDGVEGAFADNRDVLTISVHETGCWPYTGTQCKPDLGIYNFPVQPGFNDTEMAFVLDRAILPLVRRHAPEAIVLQAGADSLADDFMMGLGLSNRAYVGLVKELTGIAPRLMVLGGGGYNPWAVVRCWAAVWAALNDFDESKSLPEAAQTVLRGLVPDWSTRVNPQEHWLRTVADAPKTGRIRQSIRKLVADALE